MKNLLTALPNADFSIIDEIEGSSPTGGSFSNFGDFAAIIVNIFFGFGAAMAMIGLLLAGIRFTIAKSDIKAKQQAKQALTYSILALILVGGAYTIYSVIKGTLGG
jgi:glucose uptake protein GlcU